MRMRSKGVAGAAGTRMAGSRFGSGPRRRRAAMGQVAMSALGSSRACSPRPSPPTVHCTSQCPPIVRTANVLSARSLPYPWSSRLLRSEAEG